MGHKGHMGHRGHRGLDLEDLVHLGLGRLCRGRLFQKRKRCHLETSSSYSCSLGGISGFLIPSISAYHISSINHDCRFLGINSITKKTQCISDAQSFGLPLTSSEFLPGKPTIVDVLALKHQVTTDPSLSFILDTHPLGRHPQHIKGFDLSIC